MPSYKDASNICGDQITNEWAAMQLPGCLSHRIYSYINDIEGHLIYAVATSCKALKLSASLLEGPSIFEGFAGTL